jgi:hypothetical protein
MDTSSRNQYLKTLIEKKRYHLRTKKEKSKLLDEYCVLTGQNRNYVIRKIQTKAYLGPERKKKRKPEYGEKEITALIKIWEEFGFPCSKRLENLLKTKSIKEIKQICGAGCSFETAKKLKKITSSTIDLKIKSKKKYYRSKIYLKKDKKTNKKRKIGSKDNEQKKQSIWRDLLKNMGMTS